MVVGTGKGTGRWEQTLGGSCLTRKCMHVLWFKEVTKGTEGRSTDCGGGTVSCFFEIRDCAALQRLSLGVGTKKKIKRRRWK